MRVIVVQYYCIYSYPAVVVPNSIYPHCYPITGPPGRVLIGWMNLIICGYHCIVEHGSMYRMKCTKMGGIKYANVLLHIVNIGSNYPLEVCRMIQHFHALPILDQGPVHPS